MSCTSYETSEKCGDDYSNVFGIVQGVCHLSRGIIAQGLSMKTNTNISKHYEAKRSFSQDLTCVTYPLLPKQCTCFKHSRAEADDVKRLIKLYPMGANNRRGLLLPTPGEPLSRFGAHPARATS